MAAKTVTVELWGAHATISRQAPQHSLVLVEIAPDMNGMITATPEQARRLAAALTQMADRIEGVVSGNAPPFKIEEAMDPDFTGGLEPTEYLDKLHSGQLKTTGQHHD